MQKKIYFLLCAMMLSMSALAQGWVKPAAPASTPLSVGSECYLYNTGAEGFYLGANDWSTRASFSKTRGYKVTIQEYTLGGVAFDGSSYLIYSYIEEGSPAGNTLCLDLEGVDALWVDKDPATDEHDKAWTFVDQGDGTFRIGLSEKNSTFKESEGYEGHYLGVHAEQTDSKLYLIDVNEEPNANVKWYFVAPDKYNAYVAARKQWDAAVALGESIEVAEATTGVDATVLANAKAAYANTSSTEETLIAQKNALDAAVHQARIDQASITNPVEILASQGYGTDFTDGNVGGWQSTTNAQNKQASNGNNADDFEKTGNHYENWHWEAMNPGVISVTATELPEGVYRFEALAFTNLVGDTYLFAGDSQKKVESTKIIEDEKTEVVTFVSSGSLKVGLEVKARGANWVGFDNVGLYFLGSGTDEINYLKSNAIPDDGDFFAYCEKSKDDAYQSAKQAFEAAADLNAVKNTYSTFVTALKAKQESCDAYEKFYAKYQEVQDFLNDYGAVYTGEAMDKLVDYMEADDIGPGEKFPNGSAAYFLENGTLDAAAITAEIEYLTQLRNNAQATSMKDGDDVTGLLKNPHFNEADGWSRVGLPEWPMGPDDYKLGQAYSILFDVYQEIEGLQNGLYELTLNDFYRPANYGTTDYQTFRAYVYMNSDEAKMNHIESEATDESSYSTDYQTENAKWVPNDVNGAADAFKNGRYQQKLYGIVYDGKMKVGVRTDVRYEGCWGVWSDFKLTFRAKNVDVTKEVIAATMPNAEEMLGNKCGNLELSALSAAIEAANTASDDKVYDALVDLKNAMTDVKTCTATYSTLILACNNLLAAIEQNPSSSQITEARSLLADASLGYSNQTFDNATAAEMAERLAEMTVAIKLGDLGDEEKDVTNLIINPDFDPDRGSKDSGTIEGWVTTAMNGYKQHTVSYNRAPFHLYQDLTGLPKGKYRVTVHTYYRAGYWYDEEAHMSNGEDTKLTALYAETSAGRAEMKVKNLCDDAQPTDLGVNCYQLSNGLYAPDGTTPTVAFFNAGHYLNELEFTVGEDGKARIGLKKDQTYENDYEVVGAWTLTFLGDNDRTSLIVNPDFDPDRGSKDSGTIEGWVTTAMNGYKQHTVSYNRAPFHLYQDLTGLPKGSYLVKVHTYYRAGYWYDEEAHMSNGEDTKLTTLYAETSKGRAEMKVKNLCDDAQPTDLGVNCYQLSNGLYAPDGTTPTVAFFNAGHYLNELEFTVGEDGKARIGLKKDQTYENDYEVVGAWELYFLGDNDRTSLIVNPDFDPDRGSKDSGTIEGWVTTAMNGYKQHTVSYNRAPFHLYQDLTGLPAGEYEVTVHTYYRAGYWYDEEAHMSNGEDTKLTTLYAESSAGRAEMKVMNLCDDAQSTDLGVNCYQLSNGLYAPDGTTPTVAFFNAGHYLNKLRFIVGEDGKARIGLKKDKTYENDYEVVGAWNLYYIGKATAIENIEAAPEAEGTLVPATVVGIYNLSGIRVETPQKGINILRMSDGTSRKILVK